MFLYNITVIVDHDVHEALQKRITQQLHTSEGVTVQLLELVGSPHEGVTYCIHLHAENEEEIVQFKQEHLLNIQQIAYNDYPGKVIFFDSTLKYLTDFSQ